MKNSKLFETEQDLGLILSCTVVGSTVPNDEIMNIIYPDASPLHIAIEEGQLELAKYLISKNLYINNRDKNQYTPLQLTLLYKQYDILDMLISKGAECDLECNGILFAHLILKLPYSQLKKFVESSKLRISILEFIDGNGNTSLHFALQHKLYEVSEFLISKVSESILDHSNNLGIKALDFAILQDKPDIAEKISKQFERFDPSRSMDDAVYIKIKELLIGQDKILLRNIQDKADMNLLTYRAILCNEPGVVQYCLQAKAQKLKKPQEEILDLIFIPIFQNVLTPDLISYLIADESVRLTSSHLVYATGCADGVIQILASDIKIKNLIYNELKQHHNSLSNNDLDLLLSKGHAIKEHETLKNLLCIKAKINGSKEPEKDILDYLFVPQLNNITTLKFIQYLLSSPIKLNLAHLIYAAEYCNDQTIKVLLLNQNEQGSLVNIAALVVESSHNNRHISIDKLLYKLIQIDEYGLARDLILAEAKINGSREPEKDILDYIFIPKMNNVITPALIQYFFCNLFKSS